jgi:hypothetical protein
VLAAGADEVRLAKPLIYQEVDGVRRVISGAYVRYASNQVGFNVDAYDPLLPLVVDPVLSYSTFFGGSGEERGAAIAVDSGGYAYLAGTTDSRNFLGRNAAAQDVFLVKLNPAGSIVVYTAYLGGSGRDQVSGVAVDAAGAVYVTGATHSRDFPVANAAQPALRGDDDVYVAKLNATGAQLIYSTYLGGSGEDGGLDLAVDASGSAYVAGYTYSRDFPVVNAVQPNFGGGMMDGFVAKLNSTGSAILYATYLGGSDSDYGRSVAVDVLGRAYIAGTTASSDFPTTIVGQSLAGVADAFLVKLQPGGSAVVYSRLLGGAGEEEGFSVAADASGNPYVAGVTGSSNFPVVNPTQATLRGGLDVFVSKLNDTGGTILFSTYLGGTGDELRPSLSIDNAGRVYVAGTTASSNFPVLSPVQPNFGGGRDIFLARMQASGAVLDYSTYLGGSGVDEAWACTADPDGNAYVIGRTKSANFPTVNPVQSSPGGRGDAVIVKLRP